LDALINATVHTGNRVLIDSAVLLDGPLVAGVMPLDSLPPHARRHDLDGGVLAPGFIDLQVNGGGGVLFNDTPDPDALRHIAATHRRFGTTGMLATFITDDRDSRRQAVETVRRALAAGMPGVLGLHLEGPHINPLRRGVHDPRFIAPPEPEDLALATALPAGRTLVTLAPETVPAAAIEALVAHGTRVAAGHTAATWAQMRAGFAAGITAVTHLFNAMSPLTGREPGAVGAALDADLAWCGIIVDGHHVHDASVRVAWRAKPAGKLFLVTDAMPPVGYATDGGPDGGFQLYGEAIKVAGGRCVAADGRLAGSALDMATAVRNAVTRVGIPLDEALRMAATWPAAFMGWDRADPADVANPATDGGRPARGRIAPGFAADLVWLDRDLRVRGTWIAGKFAVP
jgi:N-acetylglucosamine-6-phosphate deacetylase